MMDKIRFQVDGVIKFEIEISLIFINDWNRSSWRNDKQDILDLFNVQSNFMQLYDQIVSSSPFYQVTIK